MTAPLPAGTPAPDRPSPARTVVVALVVGCLTLAGVIAMGWYASSDRRAAASATNTHPYILPAAAWADGAQELWQISVPADAEVVTATGYLVTIERDGPDGARAALVGYEVSEAGATRLWSTTADLARTADAVSLHVWDSTTLVHGATLIDLATGTVRAAPWPETGSVLVVDDRVITCSDPNTCHGWAPGVDVAVWSAPVPGGVTPQGQQTFAVPALHRSGQRYAVVGEHTVLNIDTGESIDLELPALQSWTVHSTADGWMVLARGTRSTGAHVYEFDLDGGAPVDDYSVTNHAPGLQVPVLGPDPLTRHELGALWRDGDDAGVIGWGTRDSATSCLVTARHGTGPILDLALVADNGDVISALPSPTCADSLIMFRDHDLVVVQTRLRATDNAFALLYDGSTGERIDFPGTSPQAGDTYALVGEQLAIGYDVDAGVVHGYAPVGTPDAGR